VSQYARAVLVLASGQVHFPCIVPPVLFDLTLDCLSDLFTIYSHTPEHISFPYKIKPSTTDFIMSRAYFTPEVGFGYELELGLRPNPDALQLLCEGYDFNDSSTDDQSTIKVF
jgi:hypothetical protein